MYWVIQDIYPHLPKFLWSIAVRSPIGWTPLTDTTDKETNERTDGRTDRQMDRDASLCPSVRSSLRWNLTHYLEWCSSSFCRRSQTVGHWDDAVIGHWRRPLSLLRLGVSSSTTELRHSETRSRRRKPPSGTTLPHTDVCDALRLEQLGRLRRLRPTVIFVVVDVCRQLVDILGCGYFRFRFDNSTRYFFRFGSRLGRSGHRRLGCFVDCSKWTTPKSPHRRRSLLVRWKLRRSTSTRNCFLQTAVRPHIDVLSGVVVDVHQRRQIGRLPRRRNVDLT